MLMESSERNAEGRIRKRANQMIRLLGQVTITARHLHNLDSRRISLEHALLVNQMPTGSPPFRQDALVPWSSNVYQSVHDRSLAAASARPAGSAGSVAATGYLLPYELLLLKYPRVLEAHLAVMNDAVRREKSRKAAQAHQVTFWRWMESVLEQKDKEAGSKNSTNSTHTPGATCISALEGEILREVQSLRHHMTSLQAKDIGPDATPDTESQIASVEVFAPVYKHTDAALRYLPANEHSSIIQPHISCKSCTKELKTPPCPSPALAYVSKESPKEEKRRGLFSVYGRSRPHHAVHGSQKGHVSSPTGTASTQVQVSAAVSELARLEKLNEEVISEWARIVTGPKAALREQMRSIERTKKLISLGI
mmetsp:Transcript_45822/g.74769  ORF Transcript_45822/g.74769 Transcript_45822/m.74769 type:complete len:366 (-) Transcript_45822:882-1979(-)